jgi:hypothetical protein
LALLFFQSLETRAADAIDRLRVPGFTAYVSPDPHGARVSGDGVSRWNDPAQKIIWGGEIKNPGWLQAGLVLRLPAGQVSRLRLTVGRQSNVAMATGNGTNTVLMNFGRFDFSEARPCVFTLESLNEKGKPNGDLDSLLLAGTAVKDAHFNLKPRRNTASVHLSYPGPQGEKIAAFYCEATGVEDPVATYYEACGWSRGYFGMQVNSPTERRIIFSVWDSGGEAVDRKKVADEDRTKLVAKGEGVVSGDFGNEGTGGHSHFVYPWKTGEKQKFFVEVKQAENKHTIYSGYWFHPEKKQWMLIASWNAPKDGHWLGGLYSFSENFGGDNGNLRRKALFGNQWVRTAEGKWIEITTAHFSHDETGGKDRFDRFMGVENGEFFLSSGGFVPGFTKYGTPFTRPATGHPPSDLNLPVLPQ